MSDLYSELVRIERLLQPAINKTMEREVHGTVQSTMIRMIKEHVYDAYTPKGREPYQRRRTSGGLEDPDNIVGYWLDDYTYAIENITTGNKDVGFDSDKKIAPIIETGIGYNWTRSQIYNNPFPRPFIKETRNKLASSKKHIKALKHGLRSRGFNVE